MGTDIHGFAEWKFNDVEDRSGAWGLVMPVPDVRNYQVFELLANVRMSGNIGHRSFADDIPLRGLPSYYRGVDWRYGLTLGDHSHTWYTLEELNIRAMWQQIEYEATRKLWLSFLKYLQWYKVGWHNCDIRILIGFDS